VVRINRPAEKEIIQELIGVARYAPTASNAQVVEWLVFTDRAKIKEYAGMTVDWMRSVLRLSPLPDQAAYLPMIVDAWDAGYDVVLLEAPVLLVASAPKEDASGMVDVTLALSYLELAAVPLGLGTCWAGLVQGALRSSAEFREVIGIPKGHTHHYPLMLGYAKPKYFRLPERRAPKITWG
jgi:nitroreductase